MEKSQKSLSFVGNVALEKILVMRGDEARNLIWIDTTQRRRESPKFLPCLGQIIKLLRGEGSGRLVIRDKYRV